MSPFQSLNSQNTVEPYPCINKEKEKEKEINEVIKYFDDLVFAVKPQTELPDCIADNEDALRLAKALLDARSALGLARSGQYNYVIKSKGFISGLLKSIQANLRHAAWMAHCVAEGDLSQRMDFLGEFSDSFNDMTQQLDKVQRQLKSQEERWRLAVECSRDGVFELNFIEDMPPFYSQRLLEIQKCDPDENGVQHPVPFEDWLGLIHTDDKKAREILTQIMSGEYNHDSWDVMFRMKDHNGEFCWRHSSGRVFFEPDGTLSRVIGVLEDIHPQKSREEQFLYRATHDFLSGLPNRDLFFQSLSRMLSAVNYAHDSVLLVVMVDLDHFKNVNDTMGHDVGDILLRDFAFRLQSAIRQSDIAARYGGDEFTLLLNCKDDTEQHIALIDRIRQTLKAPIKLKGEPYTIKVSMGIAVAPRDGGDPIVLLKCADDALYAAKRAGRDCYRFYSEVTAEDLAAMHEEQLRREKNRLHSHNS